MLKKATDFQYELYMAKKHKSSVYSEGAALADHGDHDQEPEVDVSPHAHEV